jgi:RHS repeat-associated protein
VWLDLWGGTSGTFTGLDLFNRVIDQQWQNNITGTPADIDRFKYGYDLNSNRQWKQNVVSSAASVPLDEYYNYDNLNRLTAMQRGTLTGGPPFTGIGGTPVAEQDWTLDPTGNWTAFVTKSSGTTTLNQARTANAVNEITAIGGTPGWATPPSYDAAGNMTSFPQPASPSSALTAAYDAWNQMTSVSSGGSTVATYQYDGRGRRIVKVTASISETRHFYYTPNWRDIEERVGTATTMDKQYVWGIRYVDELVCRDDATPHRLYACQDANFSLTAVVNAAGSMAERYVFYPYGGRTIYDETWSPLPSSAYEWVIGHQGLSQDIETGLIYNRIRYLNTALGRPLGRDNAGYRDGANLFQYEMSNPTNSLDPSGECTVAVRCGQVGSAGLYGNHCGLYISDNQGTGYIDGSGGNINQFGGSTTDWPGSTTGQKTSLPDDKCACLRSSMASWNALNVPRDDLTNNSNWSLRCLLRKCGLSVGFSNSDSFPEGSVGQQIPGPQGVQMPQGWNTGYNGTKPACGPPLTNCPPAFDASPGNEWQS